MTDGGTFSQETLEQGPTAIFFGFTHCPEICPATLGDVMVWQEMLEADGADPIRVFFVTVDPERDTPEVLTEYVSWAPGVVGVSGSADEVDKAIQAFRVYRQRHLQDRMFHRP